MRSKASALILHVATVIWIAGVPLQAKAQAVRRAGEEPAPAAAPDDADLSSAPAKVDINPVARDDEIGTRLQRVLDATGWFGDAHVEVDEGVVFLNGRAETEELKKWAGDLARKTQDVVAVANRIEVTAPSAWDLSPAWKGLIGLWRDCIRALPLLLFGLIVLTLFAGAGALATRFARVFLRPRIRAKLLRNVVAWGTGALVLLVGVYVILRVSGLTQLALTVVGGTGLIGLAVGIAFRDITENFLASVFLSMQQPFETGDLVEVSGVTGFVQQLNVRTTIVMTLEGNLVQIPNASVYKSPLRNFSSNANRREDFVVGIGYDDSIGEAQEIALNVLANHPAVLNEPEPSVLADSLGPSTVNLRVYFWLDGREHSWLKVRSAVIRLVKLAFQKHGISMPDQAREVVFPQGIPVTMLAEASGSRQSPMRDRPSPAQSPQEEGDAVSTMAEGGLASEAGVITKQARRIQPLKDRENLLKASPKIPSDEVRKDNGSGSQKSRAL